LLHCSVSADVYQTLLTGGHKRLSTLMAHDQDYFELFELNGKYWAL